MADFLTLEQIGAEYGPVDIERTLGDGTPLPVGWAKAGINRHGEPVYEQR